MIRRVLPVSLAFVFAVSLAACGSEEPKPTPPRTPAAPVAETTANADAGKAVSDAFTAANSGAAWFGKVERVEMDGLAVRVRTTLGKPDAGTAHDVCEAAFSAAKGSKVEFQSVAVRSADDRTLSSRNTLTGDASCSE